MASKLTNVAPFLGISNGAHFFLYVLLIWRK